MFFALSQTIILSPVTSVSKSTGFAVFAFNSTFTNFLICLRTPPVVYSACATRTVEALSDVNVAFAVDSSTASVTFGSGSSVGSGVGSGVGAASVTGRSAAAFSPSTPVYVRMLSIFATEYVLVLVTPLVSAAMLVTARSGRAVAVIARSPAPTYSSATTCLSLRNTLYLLFETITVTVYHSSAFTSTPI